MDQWKNSRVAPSNPSGAARKVHVQGSVTDTVLQLAVTNAKLSMHLAARSRQHDACTQSVAIVPKDHTLSIAMHKAGKEYDELRKTHIVDYGPHILVWKSVIQTIAAMHSTTDSAVSDADFAIISEHGAAITNPLMLVDSVLLPCCHSLCT
ncbi:unnamed protein product [Polarella glacialis]|uniref:Uncharacterized protein n=1 Tax=Polarella glacialis TaxID=89957 RepID=A0A813F4F8_POLGL|nr:unnamed protein product [Polarella glacialis]